jgi:hypothetical protein
MEIGVSEVRWRFVAGGAEGEAPRSGMIAVVVSRVDKLCEALEVENINTNELNPSAHRKRVFSDYICSRCADGGGAEVMSGKPSFQELLSFHMSNYH